MISKLTIVIALAATLALAGCGGQQKKKNTAAPSDGTQTSQTHQTNQ